MSKKLETTIIFSFGEQEEFPAFDVDIDVKTNKKSKHIKIIEHKKKTIDASTKLF